MMKTKARSNLFSELDFSRDEDFAKDVAIFASLGRDALNELPDHAVRVVLAPTARESEKASDSASRQLGIPRARLDYVLKLSQFLIGKFLKEGEGREDKPVDILFDLENIFGVSFGTKRKTALAYIKRLKFLAQNKIQLNADRQSYARRSLPVLETVSTTADYRIVFDSELEVDEEPTSFTPKCMGVIPMGIIHLGFDSGPTDTVFFQADRRSIRILINYLRALEKQLDTARQHFHLEEANDDEK